MDFARAAKENPELRTALQKVVVFKAHIHEEEGERMAELYDAGRIPQFVLMDQDGRALDRWRGYGKPADWLMQYEAALADKTPVEMKLERYAKEPTEPLASALGRIAAAQERRTQAVTYYATAQQLASKPSSWYATQIVMSKSSGVADGEFTVQEVKAAADDLFRIEPPDDSRRVTVGRILAGLAMTRKDASIVAPYLEAALQSAERSGDAETKSVRTDLLVAQALLVEKDSAKAFAVKRDSLPQGWDGDPGRLNELAWWCFEHDVSLSEAEKLARRGIDLAKENELRAAILDTAAEISNKLGDRRKAVALSTQAAQLDPQNEYLKKQVLRFAEGLDGKERI